MNKEERLLDDEEEEICGKRGRMVIGDDVVEQGEENNIEGLTDTEDTMDRWF